MTTSPGCVASRNAAYSSGFHDRWRHRELTRTISPPGNRDSSAAPAHQVTSVSNAGFSSLRMRPNTPDLGQRRAAASRRLSARNLLLGPRAMLDTSVECNGLLLLSLVEHEEQIRRAARHFVDDGDAVAVAGEQTF